MKAIIFATAITVIFTTAPGYALDGGNEEFLKSLKVPVAASSSRIVTMSTRGDVEIDPLKSVFDTTDKN